MPRRKEKTTNAKIEDKSQVIETEKQNIKKQRNTQEEKQINKNGNSRRKDKMAVKSDTGRKENNGTEKEMRKKRECNKIEKYKFSGKKKHSKEVVEVIRNTNKNKQNVGKEDTFEEKLPRKRKSDEVQKLEISDKIPVVDCKGLDCVDGDLCLENFEVSKKLKLDPWPVRSSKELTWGKPNIKSEDNETIIQKMPGNTVKKAGKRILGLKSKSKSSVTEEFDFDIKVIQECKKKKYAPQKNDKKESVESKQKKTSKVTPNNKTQGKKQPRSTKGKQDKVENQSTVDEKDIGIMSDSRSVESKKVKKPKVDLTVIPKTVPIKKPVKSDIKPSVDMGDVTSVLLMMEGKSKVMDDAQPSTSGTHDVDDVKDFITGSSGEEESDWEDVEALPGHESPKKSQIPSGPIEITLDGPQIMKKRKKKTFDVKAYFQRQLNRFQKELREHMHKVHFMCLLSRGMYLNKLCGNPVLQAQALSVIPPQFTSVSQKAFNINLLGRIIDWYRSSFPIQVTSDMMELALANRLEESFKVSAVLSYLERALVLIVLLRSLGLMTRLVMSLQPVSLKESVKKGVKGGSRPSKSLSKSTSSKNSRPNSKGEITTKNESSKSDKKKRLSKNKDNGNVIESKYFKAKNERLRSRGSKVKPSSYKDSEIDSEDDELIQTNESENENKKLKKGKEKTTSNKNGKGKTKKIENSESSSDDDDFEEDSFTVRSPVNLLRRPGIKCKNRKMVSSDSDENEPKGCDTWAEVYIEAEEKWISIDCMKCQYIGKPNVIESQASDPVHYVFSFDNNGYVKDITPRYASKWLTETRKLRVSDDWLEETVNPYRCSDTDSHAKEDNDIKASLISKPLPSSVGEFKNHPFYVLKRHLLKFEAIYPNTAIPVGYLKNNEPIYARECVHTLHSRENWLKEGRAVRLKEEAYKMVKSRPRWNRKKENPDELDLEIFGHWQTEVYIPPPAVNGKVPRNGYGNIELFMPSMLPAGTVHLQLPGLNKVAKKLDIDCVAAMTGWDTHCGYSHPVLDGFVVCEEFKDILLAAWDEDQEIQKQREAEKREKRVIQNWQLLTKGLLIKEKLKRKYLLQPHLQEEVKVKAETKTGVKSDDFKQAWPMNKKGSESLSTAKHFKTETL